MDAILILALADFSKYKIVISYTQKEIPKASIRFEEKKFLTPEDDYLNFTSDPKKACNRSLKMFGLEK